jgi:hypothetical protein
MDLTQLSQMVTWLDEEHRRDRDEIAKLDQRLQSAMVENQEQSRRIQELEGRLASTQAQLSRFTQIDQSLQQLKNEVIVMLNKEGEERLNGEREVERARMTDRETTSRAFAELRKEMPRIARLEEEQVTRRAEDQRLGEMLLAMRQALNGVSKDLDERTRSLPYMNEQRAQDNKRIAQNQADVVELFKRSDALPTKISVMEERLQRIEREVQRIQPLPDILKKEQHDFLEQVKLVDAERSRQMTVWEEAFGDQKKTIEQQVVRLREFTAQHEASQRAVAALEEFKTSVLRDQKQVSELQRMAEERQRKELATWLTENEQRWKKELLRWEYNLGEQFKVNQKTADRFLPLEASTVRLAREVEALWRVQEAKGTLQLQAAQDVLDAVGKAVGERSKAE